MIIISFTEIVVKRHLFPAFLFLIRVTVNYRLGIMGFIDFSSLEGGEEFQDAPNPGLLDHVQTLKWIHENIAGFGGDSDNVTIRFPESLPAPRLC